MNARQTRAGTGHKRDDLRQLINPTLEATIRITIIATRTSVDSNSQTASGITNVDSVKAKKLLPAVPISMNIFFTVSPFTTFHNAEIEINRLHNY
jgi:hypothetical protein